MFGLGMSRKQGLVFLFPQGRKGTTLAYGGHFAEQEGTARSASARRLLLLLLCCHRVVLL